MFFGDAESLTRSSASELTIPASRRIQAKQAFFRRMLSRIFDVQIQYAIDVGRLEKDVDKTYEIDMPQIFLRDVRMITTSLTSLASALTSAFRQRWITNEDAAKTFQMALEQLGSLGKTLRVDRVMKALNQA